MSLRNLTLRRKQTEKSYGLHHSIPTWKITNISGYICYNVSSPKESKIEFDAFDESNEWIFTNIAQEIIDNERQMM
jgi:hypothetical protein|tara:strand:+ start:940 stop:1167 length:228 start_codon:yes stop_codon:yes gene_type:complete